MKRDSSDEATQNKAPSTARVQAVRRKRAMRRAPRLLWFFLGATVFCMFSIPLSIMLMTNWAEFRSNRAQADFKAAQLASLQGTQDSLEQRLAFLQMPKGREQVLLEHGFIKPSQRVLVFPATKDVAPSSTRSDDFAPPADVSANQIANQTGTAWQKTARTLSSWIRQLRGVGHSAP